MIEIAETRCLVPRAATTFLRLLSTCFTHRRARHEMSSLGILLSCARYEATGLGILPNCAKTETAGLKILPRCEKPEASSLEILPSCADHEAARPKVPRY
jgi:hypothetical protein